MSTLAISEPGAIDRAAAVLRQGGLVAYPTDTVYGLGALATDDGAVEKLFALKQRPRDQSMPLLIASPGDLAKVAAEVPGVARRLIGQFWPGALTIVLHKAPSFRSNAVAGETVGLRVPDHATTRQLVQLLGAPITGTSANVSGGPEPLSAAAVRAQLGSSVNLILDGGRCDGGKASTVVDCTADPPRVIREGAISREELARAAGGRIE